MSFAKYFCFKCKQINACKCGSVENHHFYTHKLRVPTTKNKVVWRKFIQDCPQFINLLKEEHKEQFKDLMKEIKYPEKEINGRKWFI